MKIWPTNDLNRRFLKHPTGGPFREEGPAEWPDDTYTARRIADGDVTTEAPEDKPAADKAEAAPPPPRDKRQRPADI